LDACRQADLTKLKKYLSQEVVNFKHPYTGDTPMHCAVASPYPKRKQIIEALIRKNAAMNEKNKDFLTPLHVATDHSHYDAMDILLRHNTKVNALDGLGQTALHRYFCSGKPFVSVCLCTRNERFFNIIRIHKSSINYLLTRCAREDNMQACRILLSYNIDPSIVSLQGYTAAQIAAENVLKILQGEQLIWFDLILRIFSLILSFFKRLIL